MVVQVPGGQTKELLYLGEAGLLVEVEEEHDCKPLLGGEYTSFHEGLQGLCLFLRQFTSLLG